MSSPGRLREFPGDLTALNFHQEVSCFNCYFFSCFSAGVGRTGTLIAVDRLLQHIREHNEIDIFGTVLEMRNYRCNMVQTEVSEDYCMTIHNESIN